MPPTPALTPETEARLQTYAALLAAWTRRINLIAPADIPNIWTRHVQDSLRLLPLLPPDATTAIDLGSGAGLPGLILAIAANIHVHLVESDRRKAAFLQEAARQTNAPVTIHNTRIQNLTVTANLVTARALAPLPELLALATPHLAPGGTMLFPKGAKAPQEIDAARTTWRFNLAIADNILIITNPAREAVNA